MRGGGGGSPEAKKKISAANTFGLVRSVSRVFTDGLCGLAAPAGRQRRITFNLSINFPRIERQQLVEAAQNEQRVHAQPLPHPLTPGPRGAARNLPVRCHCDAAAAHVQSPQQTLICLMMRPAIFTPHLLPANSSPADLTARHAEAPAAAGVGPRQHFHFQRNLKIAFVKS